MDCPPATPLKTMRTPPHRQKGTAHPPINITLQDIRDTIALMENPLKIRNFHNKRVRTGKHVLYLQNLSDYTKGKEILTAVNTAYYTCTPKSENTTLIYYKGQAIALQN